MHTPTPWKAMIRGDGQTEHSVYVDIPNGHGIIADEIRNPDNAAFIVQACNAHDALVAACTELLDALEASTYDHEWVDIKEQALVALALAEPQEAVR